MSTYTALPGSVSSGTMRSEDLVPSFTTLLRSLAIQQRDDANGHLQLCAEAEAALAKDADSEETSSCIEALFDALDEYSPEGHHFGAHEGDGADYGFWPVDVEDEPLLPTGWEEHEAAANVAFQQQVAEEMAKGGEVHVEEVIFGVVGDDGTVSPVDPYSLPTEAEERARFAAEMAEVEPVRIKLGSATRVVPIQRRDEEEAGETDITADIGGYRIFNVGALQAALGTEEEDEALVEVAREAHKAEQAFATAIRLIRDISDHWQHGSGRPSKLAERVAALLMEHD